MLSGADAAAGTPTDMGTADGDAASAARAAGSRPTSRRPTTPPPGSPGRLPDDWFTGAPTVTVDREEIVVIGELAGAGGGGRRGAGRPPRRAASAASARTPATPGCTIADEAEARYGRKVAWGASIGDDPVLFTHLAVPVMTRLRQDERRVLDTLVDAGRRPVALRRARLVRHAGRRAHRRVARRPA